MRYQKIISSIIVLGCLFYGFGGIVVNAIENEQKYIILVEPYTFELVIKAVQIKTATDTYFSVRLLGDNSEGIINQPLNLSLRAEPGANVGAIPLKLAIIPNNDGKSWDGKFSILVSGNWHFKITATGSKGVSTGQIMLNVVPPPALPQWLAFLIALSPLGFLIGFVIIMARKAVKKHKIYYEGLSR
jgi:hypothetical protein